MIELAKRRGVWAEDFDLYVETGLLLCDPCKLRYPIVHGVPIMLPYRTHLHQEFDARRKPHMQDVWSGYQFADRKPVEGEEFVRASFSTEWLEYDYDGVIWESTYEAHQERILLEMGPAAGRTQWHLEIGCGLGLAALAVQEASGCDAVGLDLSMAAVKAAQHFKLNPFMHFVQASAFSIPLAKDQFDTIYSRGVLHHTYSTERAFKCVAQHCRPGGTFYVWLYGPGSIRSTPLRVGLYGIEALTRPLVSHAPDSLPARAFLGTMALGYLSFNALRRLGNRATQPLSFSRAVHAARDRFTPRFAHRHPAAQVLQWYKETGFKEATVLDWRKMPLAEQDDFRRNVGVRAVRV